MLLHYREEDRRRLGSPVTGLVGSAPAQRGSHLAVAAEFRKREGENHVCKVAVVVVVLEEKM